MPRVRSPIIPAPAFSSRIGVKLGDQTSAKANSWAENTAPVSECTRSASRREHLVSVPSSTNAPLRRPGHVSQSLSQELCGGARSELRMRSPPLVPQGFDFETYIVLDDFGKLGRAYREVDDEQADKTTVIRNISDGQYHNPVRRLLSTLPKDGHGT